MDGSPPMPDADTAPAIVELRNLSKSFGPVRALRDVSLTLRPGEIHSLMGENGAGKSTLIRLLSGAINPDARGGIVINGQEIAANSPALARRLGVSVVYQELSLAPNLTVAENIFLGEEPRRLGLIDRKTMMAEAAPLLAALHSRVSPGDVVGRLDLADRQLVEIARALRRGARVLVLDEPTTSLSAHESEALFATLRRLRREGISILYVSHRMEEVYDLSDRVSVLRDGAYVGTLTRAELTPERLVRMMVGREIPARTRGADTTPAAGSVPRLEVRGLTDHRKLVDINFDLRPGEVLGFAGLIGAGRSELARALYGARHPVSGKVRLDGRPLQPRNPQAALSAGLAYLTEDRRGDGLFLDMTIRDNLCLIAENRFAAPGGLRRAGRAAVLSAELTGRLGVRMAHDRQKISALSGGNQQKVLLGRLLATRPRVVILDEPTRGIDLAAKAEVYDLIATLASEGMGVIVISSELAELSVVADRVLVMREGRLAGEVANHGEPQAFQAAIVALATGVEAGTPLEEQKGGTE